MTENEEKKKTLYWIAFILIGITLIAYSAYQLPSLIQDLIYFLGSEHNLTGNYIVIGIYALLAVFGTGLIIVGIKKKLKQR